MMHAHDLAVLLRAGMPFPEDHGEEPAEPGGEYATGEWGVLGEIMPGGKYLRFWCPDCQTSMYQANSDRGIRHARKVARVHKPACCERRAAGGKPSTWPDEE